MFTIKKFGKLSVNKCKIERGYMFVAIEPIIIRISLELASVTCFSV
jgi:hypothetical protein